MSTKLFFPCVLALAGLTTASLRAQDLPPSPTMLDPGRSGAAYGEELPPPSASSPGRLSSWITGSDEGWAGCVGGSGPIHSELYVRTGPSLVVAGPIMESTLQTGWNVTGGGRTLFFNTTRDADWTLDLGIAYTYNHAHNSAETIPFVFPVASGTNASGQPTGITNMTIPVTLRQLDRTTFNFAGGREWYVRGAANSDGLRWRVGLDVGGRLGSERAEFNETTHRTATDYGVTLAGHSDIEIPWGGFTLLAGLRTEWGYNWSHILQTNDADFQDVNILLTAGIRF